MTHLVQCFGLAVRQLREQKGWSQEALAEKADLNRSFVGELERGQATPSLLTLKKLAEALEVTLTTLVQRIERNEQTKMVKGIELTSIAC